MAAPNLVTLVNGEKFACDRDQSILEAAKSAGLILEYSCRTGRCGVCAAKVLTGTTKLLNAESSLPDEQSQSGFVLTCCRSATTDLKLDIEDLGELAEFKSMTIPARIDSIDLIAEDVIQVVLRTPPSSPLKFRAGQYIDVIGPEGIRRSYSLANAPRDDAKLVLEVKRVEGGVLSEYWFERAQKNDLLRLEGPMGTFCLRPKALKNLIFLATGTGIAPIKAILQELEEGLSIGTKKFDQIYLYWGGRFEKDLYWSPDLHKLSINYFPTLSRSPGWGGREGYVQQAVLKDRIDLVNSTVYACGSEKMINSAKKTLTDAGLDKTDFYSDAFVRSGW